MASWRTEYSRYKGFFLNVVNFYKSRHDLMMFLEILLSTATIAIFTAFALKPTAITIIELWKEIKSKEEVIAKMDTKLADLKKAQANYQKEAARIQDLDTAVPTQPNPEKFMRQVQGIAYNDIVDLTGVAIDEVMLLGTPKVAKKVTQESLPSGAQGISFFINLKGDFTSLNTLLSDLEYMRRPIKIDALKMMTQKKEELSAETLIFSISGQAPYFLIEQPTEQQQK